MDNALEKSLTNNNLKMWAVLVVEPNDIYPMPTREVADAFCLVLNNQFERHPMFHDPMGIRLHAEVIEWPHGFESWAAEKDLNLLEVIPAK